MFCPLFSFLITRASPSFSLVLAQTHLPSTSRAPLVGPRPETGPQATPPSAQLRFLQPARHPRSGPPFCWATAQWPPAAAWRPPLFLAPNWGRFVEDKRRRCRRMPLWGSSRRCTSFSTTAIVDSAPEFITHAPQSRRPLLELPLEPRASP